MLLTKKVFFKKIQPTVSQQLSNIKKLEFILFDSRIGAVHFFVTSPKNQRSLNDI